MGKYLFKIVNLTADKKYIIVYQQYNETQNLLCNSFHFAYGFKSWKMVVYMADDILTV